MRGSLVLLFAALALAGCKRTSPAPPQPKSEPSTTPAPPPVASASTPAPEERSESFFDPDAEALVISKDSPNMRYAQLGRDACFAELGRRGIAFEEAHAPPAAKPKTAMRKPVKWQQPARKPAKAAAKKPTIDAAADMSSILAPIRLRGPLHNVTFHSGLAEKTRATASIEIFDCRLVLALDDFATVLEKHKIVEVVHMSAFRPSRDRGCFPKFAGKQHCGALAVDLGTFKTQDGTVLDVEKDFNGHIGTATCTTGAGPKPVTPSATALWDIVCESARRGLFHVMLTPNYNTEHKNHFHVEITPGVGWMLVK